MKINIMSILILSLLLLNCSNFHYVKYMEGYNNLGWNDSLRSTINRTCFLFQERWQYSTDEITVEVDIIPLRDFPITFGPPYLPVIPLFPLRFIFNPRYFLDGESLGIRINISSENDNCTLDLRTIWAEVISDSNISTKTAIPKDIHSRIYPLDWISIDKVSGDLSKFSIELTEKPYRFLLYFDQSLSDTENVVVRFRGILNNGKEVEIPNLFFLKKGKLHFDAFKFAD